jgi:hypothetical protein
MSIESFHQLFIQEHDGELMPTDEQVTVSEWEKSKFCFDPETLHDHTRYYAFKQISPTTKLWIRITSFSLI